MAEHKASYSPVFSDSIYRGKTLLGVNRPIENSNFVFSLICAMRTHHRGIYLLAKHDTLTYDEKLQRNNNIYKDKNYVKNLGSSHVNASL